MCIFVQSVIHSTLSQVVDENNDAKDYPLFALAEAIYMSGAAGAAGLVSTNTYLENF